MSKKQVYRVGVIRSGYGHREFEIKAKNAEEAEELALEEAGNHEYSEHSSEYEVDFVVPTNPALEKPTLEEFQELEEELPSEEGLRLASKFSDTEVIIILEIARAAMADSNTYESIAEGMDLSDDVLLPLLKKLESYTNEEI